MKITTVAFLIGFHQKKKTVEAEVQATKGIRAGEVEVRAGHQSAGAGAEVKIDVPDAGVGVEVEAEMLIGRIVDVGLEVEVKVEIEVNIGKKRRRVEGGQGVCHHGIEDRRKIGLLRLIIAN